MASRAIAPAEQASICRLPIEALALIFAWTGRLDNTTLWRDVPRVCKLWADVCKSHPLGVCMEFAVQFVDRRGRESAGLVEHVHALAHRHCRPRSTILHVSGPGSWNEVAEIAEQGGKWINGFIVESGCRLRSGYYSTMGPQLVHTIAEHCPNLIHIGLPVSRGYDLAVPGQMDEMLAILCAAYPHMETLDISHWPLSDKGSLLPLTGCTKLRGLSIGFHTAGMGLATVMERCPNLHLANIEARGLPDGCLKVEQERRGSKVTVATYTNNSSVTAKGFDAFVKACPNIKTVRMSCPRHPLAAMTSVAARCSKLTTLVLVGSDTWDTFTDDMMDAVIALRRVTLTNLDLQDCHALTSETLALIGFFLGRSLTTLRLRLSNATLRATTYATLFGKCSTLKHLDLVVRRNELTEEVVAAITTKCPQLETLRLGYACGSHGFGGYHGFGSLLQLRELTLIRCGNTPTENTFRTIGSTCLLLTKLEIHSLHVLSDRDVRPIVRGLKALQVLSLYPTTATLTRRSFGKGQAPLQQLTLHRNAGLSPDELSAIVALLPALRTIDVSWCRRIESRHAKQLMLQYLNLTVLCRDDCTFYPVAKFTEKRLLGIPPYLPP
jgi:hypothetical protein